MSILLQRSLRMSQWSAIMGMQLTCSFADLQGVGNIELVYDFLEGCQGDTADAPMKGVMMLFVRVWNHITGEHLVLPLLSIDNNPYISVDRSSIPEVATWLASYGIPFQCA